MLSQSHLLLKSRSIFTHIYHSSHLLYLPTYPQKQHLFLSSWVMPQLVCSHSKTSAGRAQMRSVPCFSSLGYKLLDSNAGYYNFFLQLLCIIFSFIRNNSYSPGTIPSPFLHSSLSPCREVWFLSLWRMNVSPFPVTKAPSVTCFITTCKMPPCLLRWKPLP